VTCLRSPVLRARRLIATVALLAWSVLLPPAATADAPDFVRMMREEGRAVVNISASRVVRISDFDGAMPEDASRDAGEFDDLELHSLGSGFIISDDGYLVTNAHVAGSPGRQEILVRLFDRREFRAKVVGVDRTTDIALLKIDVSGLPTVRVGDPSQLQPGEWVAAVGSPFGFERSITAGIVSAMGRALPEESYAPFIQTDVAVNPGNSGGPLFNLRGEVVGVNSVIYSGSGGYMGLSFAIPIDLAMEVVEQLRSHGRVTRGRIGVRLQEMTAELARALRLPRVTGALIVHVDRGGSADRAGVRAGDVVVGFGGKEVTGDTDLIQMTVRARPRTIVEAELWRQGRLVALRMEIDPVPTQESRVRQAPAPAADRRALLLAPLSAEQRARIEVEGGLLVRQPDDNAQRAGLQRGDVIVSANGKSVNSVSAFRAIVSAAGDAGVALLVHRGGERLFVALRGRS
jgi:serine protease Do